MSDNKIVDIINTGYITLAIMLLIVVLLALPTLIDRKNHSKGLDKK